MRILLTLAGRVAALSLAAGAIALVLFGVLRPFTARLAELDQDRRLVVASIERMSARVQHRDSFAERLAELEREVFESEAHIRAGTTSLGAAEMQRLLSEAAPGHGVQVQSTQALPSAEEAGFQRITLRADVTGEFPGIVQLLQELESGRPYIFLEAVDMRASPGTVAAETQHPVLSVRMDLVAYMLGPQT